MWIQRNAIHGHRDSHEDSHFNVISNEVSYAQIKPTASTATCMKKIAPIERFFFVKSTIFLHMLEEEKKNSSTKNENILYPYIFSFHIQEISLKISNS